jgi:hypothetical protein
VICDEVNRFIVKISAATAVNIDEGDQSKSKSKSVRHNNAKKTIFDEK